MTNIIEAKLKRTEKQLEKTELQLDKALKLFTISSELHRTLNIDEVYNTILDTIKQIIGGKDCSILIRDIESGKLELTAFIGKKLSKSPIVCYPLKLGNENIGEIHINSLLPQKDVLSDEDRELLALLAEESVMAITGAMFSITDGLTGVYNHRHFWERLSEECERSKRYISNLCLLMIDIDLFKVINDDNGHKFGDFMLKKVAALLKRGCRESDIIFRYGGDEFSIILTETDYRGANAFAEKIRKLIEAYNFRSDNKIVRATVSIGVSSLLEDNVISENNFVAFADSALFYAKSIGRNRTVHFKNIRQEYIETKNNKNKTEDFVSKINMISEGIKRSTIESITTLIKAMEARNPYSEEHSINVMNYSLLIAKKMNLPKEEVEIIRNSSLMHDIGKIGINESILLKNAELTEEERNQINSHPFIGISMVEHIEFLRKSLPNILHHHERYNGNGYPSGLKKDEIPLGARIIAAADAFDAMSSPRPYRDTLSSKKIIEEMVSGAGTQFFPEIVYRLLQVIKEYKLLPELSGIDEAIEKVSKKESVYGQLFAKQASKQASLKKKFLQNSCSFEKIVNKISTERYFKETKQFMVFMAN